MLFFQIIMPQTNGVERYINLQNHEKRVREMDHKTKHNLKVLIFTSIILFIGTSLMMYVVIRDVAYVSGHRHFSLDDKQDLMDGLEYSINTESEVGLERAFIRDEYKEAFSKILFGQEVSIDYGFSDYDRIKSRNHVPLKDFPSLRRGYSKEIAEGVRLAYLMVEHEDDPENIFTPAAIMKRYEDEWRISRLYDLMHTDSELLSVEDFHVNYIDEIFSVTLGEKSRDSYIRSTSLYNFALSVEEIRVSHDNETICTMDRNDIRAEGKEIDMEIKEDLLHNPRSITIEGDCNLGDIMEEDGYKYMLDVTIESEDKDVDILYYGNMIK